MSTDDVTFRWLRKSDFFNGYQKLQTVHGNGKLKSESIKISKNNIDFNP